LGSPGEPGDRLGRDALARPGLADDRQGLAPVHIERQPPDGLDDPVRGVEGHVQVTHLQQGHGLSLAVVTLLATTAILSPSVLVRGGPNRPAPNKSTALGALAA